MGRPPGLERRSEDAVTADRRLIVRQRTSTNEDKYLSLAVSKRHSTWRTVHEGANARSGNLLLDDEHRARSEGGSCVQSTAGSTGYENSPCSVPLDRRSCDL